MTRRFRRALLAVLRALGAFAVSRIVTRRALRILCYHGMSLDDEHRFRPHLFIRCEELERRLAYLRRKGFSVLSLEEALAGLENGELPARPVVLTFDDGFYSTFSQASPLLERFRMPATLYLSTYYVKHQQPVYNLVLAYCFWRTDVPLVDLNGLDLPAPLATIHRWEVMTPGLRSALVDSISAHAGDVDAGRREVLLRRVAERLNVDVKPLFDSRAFAFVSESEVRLLHERGMGIELHTHRHRSPGARDEALAELRENQEIILAITGHRSLHFCYPSGRSDRWDDDWLAALGIKSATSIRAGFNYPDTPRLHLRRFLDSSAISPIEFEAELSGVLEIARRMRPRAGR